jgi:hypothetical protein
MVDRHEISYHPSCAAISLEHLQILTFSPHHDQEDDHKVRGDATTHRMLILSRRWIGWWIIECHPALLSFLLTSPAIGRASFSDNVEILKKLTYLARDTASGHQST